ncbi:hypothetical protein HDF16_005926 [Granulicella aggregans]|uniref:Uncharacterized protein n=1 Tax=Granulicella aggregans TaxID=474949 RepID=A0A7W8E8E3_9BACT|nr:hypothetical protein [Granulicella aggregans]MBB5061190.1 hypothetical protein [Granulicella aggregans]
MKSYLRQAILGITGIVGIALLCSPLHSQTSNLPPGVIDGSKTPELIPDSTAFRLVFLSLRVPQSPTEGDLKKQEMHFKRIGLSDVDKAAARDVLSHFHTAYHQWQTKYIQTSNPIDMTAARSEREAIVEETTASFINQLSSDGATKLAKFVQSAKVRMIVRE